MCHDDNVLMISRNLYKIPPDLCRFDDNNQSADVVISESKRGRGVIFVRGEGATTKQWSLVLSSTRLSAPGSGR